MTAWVVWLWGIPVALLVAGFVLARYPKMREDDAAAFIVLGAVLWPVFLMVLACAALVWGGWRLGGGK